MFIYISGFKPGSHWSIPSCSKTFGALKEECCNINRGHLESLENESLIYIDGSPSSTKRLRPSGGFPNGVGSNSSIDLEWETAEGKEYITMRLYT